MNWIFFMNMIASTALFTPVIMIMISGFSLRRHFPALLVYYIVTFIYSLMTGGFITVDDKTKYYFGITNNLLDGPLMLSFLIYLCYTARQVKLLKILVLSLLIFNTAIVAVTGYNINAIRIVLAPSILLVLFFSCKFFIRYTKMTVRKPGGVAGKTLLSASLVGAYSTFTVIYFLFYVIKTKNVQDAYLVYFLATILSSCLMSFGIYYEWQRNKRIKEVQIMRKELAILYKDESTMTPRKKIRSLDDLFDFDPSKVIPGFRN